MGKHVVYLRKQDEAELEAKGLDPGEWVRNTIYRALGRTEQPLFPEQPDIEYAQQTIRPKDLR